MIVEFSVKNFRSIKDLQTISFVATGLKSAERYAGVDQYNIAEEASTHMFKTVGIYGANASGKSNVIKAMDYFIDILRSQPSAKSNLGQLCDPFLYQENYGSEESFFQIVVIIKGVKYRYGITVKTNDSDILDAQDNRSNEIITNEWLFANKVKNMTVLFERKGIDLVKNNLDKKEAIPELIPYAHSLYLTHAAAFDNSGACKIITSYFQAYTISNFKFDHENFRWMSMQYIKTDSERFPKKDFLELLASFNLRYDDVYLQEGIEDNREIVFPQDKITLIKKIKTNSGNFNVKLNLKNNESAGSQKLFDLAGLLLLTFSFQEPAFIILDEIDSNFHPSLLIQLVKLFNDPTINRSNSQLLFTSHDTNLMSPAIMRRDQFYFTEKNEDNSSRLYSLADLKGIRNDADFAKQYLAGYYGALPILVDYSHPNSDLND